MCYKHSEAQPELITDQKLILACIIMDELSNQSWWFIIAYYNMAHIFDNGVQY